MEGGGGNLRKKNSGVGAARGKEGTEVQVRDEGRKIDP